MLRLFRLLWLSFLAVVVVFFLVRSGEAGCAVDFVAFFAVGVMIVSDPAYFSAACTTGHARLQKRLSMHRRLALLPSSSTTTAWRSE